MRDQLPRDQPPATKAFAAHLDLDRYGPQAWDAVSRDRATFLAWMTEHVLGRAG